MFLSRLLLENFRCYAALNQTFNTPISIIDGDNGSGKTALIEAIYWQSTGRSFRHHKSKQLIQHEQNQLSVFSEYISSDNGQSHKLGVGYTRDNIKTIKLNNQQIKSQTDIAQHFPVVSIDPNAFLWIDHAPGFRRSYLDWLVFHVEPNYLPIWKKTQKIQQHLNKLLKNGGLDELPLWQEKYSQLAEQTHQYRSGVVARIEQKFKQLAQYFLPHVNGLTISYNKGWSSSDLFAELIQKQNIHLKQGFVGLGVNKADLICLNNNKSAQVVLSRGQKKLLAIIMYLVYIEIYEDKNNKSPVICIDDIDSELDAHALALLANYIQNKQRQIFITTVNAYSIKPYFNESETFHVKQDNSNHAVLS